MIYIIVQGSLWAITKFPFSLIPGGPGRGGGGRGGVGGGGGGGGPGGPTKKCIFRCNFDTNFLGVFLRFFRSIG